MTDEKQQTNPEPEQIAPQAINALLQEGVDFDITIEHPNILHRLKILPKVKTMRIYPVNYYTLLKISKILVKMDKIGEMEDDVDLFNVGIQNIVNNSDKILEIIALAVINNKLTVYQKIRKIFLKSFIEQNLSVNELLQLTQIVLMQMGVTDFLALSVLIRQMNLLKADKKETNQT